MSLVNGEYIPVNVLGASDISDLEVDMRIESLLGVDVKHGSKHTTSHCTLASAVNTEGPDGRRRSHCTPAS